MSPQDEQPYLSIALSWQAALVFGAILTFFSGIGIVAILRFLGVL